MTTDNFCIVITEPFCRALHYQFDSREEAENIAFVIRIAAYDGELERMGISRGTEVETMVVPTNEVNTYYDA